MQYCYCIFNKLDKCVTYISLLNFFCEVYGEFKRFIMKSSRCPFKIFKLQVYILLKLIKCNVLSKISSFYSSLKNIKITTWFIITENIRRNWNYLMAPNSEIEYSPDAFFMTHIKEFRTLIWLRWCRSVNGMFRRRRRKERFLYDA